MKYIKMVKNVISVDLKEILSTWGMTALGGIVGLAICLIVYFATGQDVFLPFTALFAMIAAGLTFFLGKIFTVTSGFTLAVSMNRSRLTYTFAKYLSIMVEVIGTIGVLELAYHSEKWIAKLLGNQMEIELVSHAPIMTKVAGTFLAPILVMLLGVLYVKFDKKLLWTLWGVFMIFTIAAPRIAHAMRENPDSFISKVGFFFQSALSLNTVATVILALAATVVCIIACIILYSKTEIKA